tara:strand:+ start:1248 stop:1976 length:729 start_codon:yes stop_codon:yes gene_type:complete
MAYFLGRDVDVFLTTESKNNHSGSTVQFLVESGGEIELSTAAGTGQIVPPMANDAAVVSGSISDVTGVDLSISVSDEDVGPFLGKPQIMQKVELRKETVVTLTLKKKNNFFDVMFNGPAASTKFDGGAIKASRQGARFGVGFGGATIAKISDGSKWMYDQLEKSETDKICYGYRLHLRLKDNTAGEIFTLKNAVMTGHTVSLNADGVTEETIEFTSSVAPSIKTPTGEDTGFDTTLTTTEEL